MPTQTILKSAKDRMVAMEKVRNIGIIAHISAGKTTTTERILFYTGKTHKLGSTDDGTTVTNYMEQEKERKLTIKSAAVTTFWKPAYAKDTAEEPYRINIIDTPGHVDFTAEVERSLRVLDGAITVLDAEEGVQSQSETVWRQASKYEIPSICYANKMDKVGADFYRTVSMVEERFSVRTAVMVLPIGREHDFKGVVTLLDRKALLWDESDPNGEKYQEAEVPEAMKAEVEKAREQLIERISETDEKLLEKFVNGQEPTIDELKAALRKATISFKLVPFYCGSSFRNKAVQPLIDAVCDYLPSPLDIPPVKGIDPNTGQEEIRETRNDAPFAALAFKIQVDPHVGKLTFLRVYSGTLKAGSGVLNVSRKKTERIGRLLLMYADKREEISQAYAGEIVAAVGLKETGTGDTLTEAARPVLLESITFPEPVISLAIEPKTKADQEKLGTALKKLAEEDPTFKIKVNHETGQTIISGMGELHLEIIVDRMRREFNVMANTGEPQVAYKETIKEIGEGEGKYIRQSGGRGQYGDVWLKLEPLPRGSGFQFVNEASADQVLSNYVSSVERGAKGASENGPLAGYPATDIKVTLTGGSFHEVDSSDMAFEIAGSMAFTEAINKCDVILLEPIMKAQIIAPLEYIQSRMINLILTLLRYVNCVTADRPLASLRMK